jgi:hypothetical protein
MRAHEEAKILGSASAEIAASALVHFRASVLRVLRRSQSSPTRISTARVAANRVRSIVRPANFVDLTATPLDEFGLKGAILVFAALSFDCSNFMPRHADINDENHLVSL